MKVKKLLKVISPNTDIIFWDNYGGWGKICASTNVQKIYLERKVEEIWLDDNPLRTLNITIEGSIE